MALYVASDKIYIYVLNHIIIINHNIICTKPTCANNYTLIGFVHVRSQKLYMIRKLKIIAKANRFDNALH